MEQYNVVVLLSSYNGEEYIKDQIDSVLNQKDIEVHLVIRDDGSVDNTIKILKQYEERPNCKVIYGKNIGACSSFMWLISNAPKAEYYSFCDQDDIWDDDKLITAIKIINSGNYQLYHGLAGRVDKSLNKLYDKKYIPTDSFGASLLASATGCTMVYTNTLQSKLREYSPKYVSMHDAWVYRVCYALGFDVYYDHVSHMKYRQHSNNVSGGQMSLLQKILKIKKNAGLKYRVAQSIKDCCWNDMPIKNKIILQTFIEYRYSIKAKYDIMHSGNYRQNSVKTSILNNLLLLFNLV